MKGARQMPTQGEDAGLAVLRELHQQEARKKSAKQKASKKAFMDETYSRGLTVRQMTSEEKAMFDAFVARERKFGRVQNVKRTVRGTVCGGASFRSFWE